MAYESLFTVSNDRIMVTSVIPSPEGYRVRLYNAGGAPEEFRINSGRIKIRTLKIIREDGSYEYIQPDKVLRLPAFGIMEPVLVK